jgi:hypothetical protein
MGENDAHFVAGENVPITIMVLFGGAEAVCIRVIGQDEGDVEFIGGGEGHVLLLDPDKSVTYECA